ncbi:glucose 1-dehydrogenase [Leptolyngbya iicbica]|uniref:Glucose 1-dehydrogenase n=2 Tax=Cyanophyceae TaxID=3028117 RepID=A0A4Q7EGL1_9CYAN|nr:glucose 1-dehydrogenase [Leptolyngbya sp. LK]RZM82108.1 glucose 1-dehydrogenase [Leptolyngbya sp. LK]
MKGLQGKTAIVTGASSGIGQAIAVRLAAEGCNVVINYRSDAEGAEATAQQAHEGATAAGYPSQTLKVQADVSQVADIKQLFDTAIATFGRLDILVNNAGIQMEAASHEVSPEDFDKVINVNLRGAYLCARAAIQQFLQQSQPGSIINVSSVHEVIPRPQYISYSISKGGMGNLTRTLALEYARQGIRVNAIAPGATETPINDDWVDDPQQEAIVNRHIPLGRPGTPEEMAAATAFLLCDEATYITGQTLYIDGGLTLYADFREPWSA